MRIYNTHFGRLMSVVLASVSVMCLCAAPARPGSRVALQPDGSEITVTLHGDEKGHYYTGDDGCLLVCEGGAYYYADIDASEAIVSSGVMAHDSSRRSVAELSAVRIPAERAICASLESLRSQHEAGGVYSRSYGLSPELVFPSQGSPHILTILVSYQDVDFKVKDPKDHFYRMLNEPGFSDYGGTGSVKDYFVDNSLGQFVPELDIYGPVKLPEPRSYYGKNDRWGSDENAEMMAVHACQMLDDEIDFSRYDNNGDGLVDVVFIYYAGMGESSGGPDDSVWPHQYELDYVNPREKYVFDGVRINRYACTSELESVTNPDGIGTFVHEFSHVMGLPDIYAVTNSLSFTPEGFDVLDVGCYNNNGCTPPCYSSYERYSLGWLTPPLIEDTRQVTMAPIAENEAFRIATDAPNEYFFIENRQLEGWDKYLPGHGMLVWHVDYKETIWLLNKVNDNSSHQYVDLIEADNVLNHLSRKGDPFPGSDSVTSLTEDTEPALLSWSKTPTGINLYDIKEEDGMISLLAKRSGTTAISDMAADEPVIYTTPGAIHVGAAGGVAVYDALGQCVYRGEDARIDVNRGLYIVKTGTVTVKVSVR